MEVICGQRPMLMRMPRALRSNSKTPNMSSSSRMVFVTASWLTCTISAARMTLFCRATSTKIAGDGT